MRIFILLCYHKYIHVIHQNTRTKRKIFEGFAKDMERDMYASQRKIWGMSRRNKLKAKDTTQTSKITKSKWEAYFENLFCTEEEELEQHNSDIN